MMVSRLLAPRVMGAHFPSMRAVEPLEPFRSAQPLSLMLRSPAAMEIASSGSPLMRVCMTPKKQATRRRRHMP
jgi:hypothetical protein